MSRDAATIHYCPEPWVLQEIVSQVFGVISLYDDGRHIGGVPLSGQPQRLQLASSKEWVSDEAQSTS